MAIRTNLLSTSIITLVACGGSTGKPGATTPGSATADSSISGGADLVIEVNANPLVGLRFVPEALNRPGMPLVESKKKQPVDKQRIAIDKEKDPENREVLAQVLATTLYQTAKAEKEPAKQTPLFDDARAVLKQAVEKNGGKAVDPVTLQMLGVFALIKGDFAGAEQAYEALVTLNPKAKDISVSKTWWAHALLAQNKNAAAAAVVKDIATFDDAELAYVAAWARYRTGDGAGSMKAITAAVKGWKNSESRKSVDNDFLRIAGRSNVPFEDTVAATASIGNKDDYPLMFQLSQSYSFGGRYKDAIAAIEKAIAAGGAKTPKNDIPKLRWLQTEASLRLDEPEQSAKFGKQTLDALTACGDACTAEDKKDLLAAVRQVGQRFHSVYATSQDARYYQPARDLYAAVASAGDGSDELAKLAKQIDTTKATAKPGNGTHDKDVVASIVGLHAQEVQACYEAQLAGSPAIGGGIILTMEVDDKGAVTGASSNPAAGGADMAAVAGCIIDRARSWRLPSRGKPGVTRINAKFELSAKK
jgi:tetratricopeptide (TPR) repeat protein